MRFRCSRRQWLAFALCGAWTPRVVAHDAAHPHEPDAEEIALGSLADAELAFARAARERGRRAALAAYMSPDGVALEQSALRATDFARERDVSLPSYDAQPAQVTVSRAHDLGCVSGTYAVTHANARTARHGVYLSVWRRVRERWGIVLTASVGTPAPVDFVVLGAAPRPAYRGKAAPQVERVKLLGLDARVRAAAHREGLLAASLRTYRDGAMPRIGPPQDGTAHASAFRVVHVAQSADLAALSGAVDARRTAWYLHVWLRDAAGAWQLAYDLETPARRGPE